MNWGKTYVGHWVYFSEVKLFFHKKSGPRMSLFKKARVLKIQWLFIK